MNRFSTVIGSAVLLLTVFSTSLNAQSIEGPEVADTLKEAVITDMISRKHNSTQTGHKRLSRLQLISSSAFLSTPDIIKVLQNLPGVASGTEIMSGLYVHGGDGSDNLFLLDDVPLYQVTHVGGLFSSFNTDITSSLDFYKSGFPARYGGRMSSVVDIRTTEGDSKEYHGSASIGLIDGRISLSGPIIKDRTSFSVAMRRTWMDAVLHPMISYLNKGQKDGREYGGSYAFHDINAGITHRFSSGDRLSLRFYNGFDHLTLSESLGTDTQGAASEDAHNIDNDIKWGNTTLSVNWDRRYSNTLTHSVTAYWSASDADVSYDYTYWEKDAVIVGQLHRKTTDETNISDTDDIGLKADFDYLPDRMQHIRFGTAYTTHLYAPQRRWTHQYDGHEISGRMDDRYSGHEAALYLEDELSPAPWISINAGVRYALFFTPGKTWQRLEPRAALSIFAGKSLNLKMSYTEMNQFSHLVSTTWLDLPTNCWMPSTAIVAPSRARQIAAGAYWRLPWNMRLNVEGYYKTMDNLLEYGGANSMFPPLDGWELAFNKGKGKAYGMEMELGYDDGRTELAAYYTLSWSLRRFDAVFRTWYPDRNDNRHKLTLMASRKIGKNISINAVWNWRKGNRMTAESHSYTDVNGNEVMVYSSPNNIQLPDYHRLDIGADFTRTTRGGNRSIWNVSIYNVYNRKNAVLATVGLDDQGRLIGKARAIFPIIPSFSYTFLF